MQNLSTVRFDQFKVRYLLLVLILMHIGVAILLIPTGITVKDKLYTPISYIGAFVSTCIWIWYRCKQVKIDLRQIIGKSDRPVRWMEAIGLVFATQLFSISSILFCLGLLSYAFPSFTEQLLVLFKNSSDKLATSNSDPLLYRILMFLVLVVFAPLTEELIFRGMILNRWAQKWNLPISIIATSILFGCLHINPIGIAMFAVIQSLLYLKTKTLWVPIATHAFNNFIVFCVSLLPTAQSTTPTAKQVGLSIEYFHSSLWISLALMMLSLLALGRFIHRNFPSKQLSSFN
jgi:uncharacterized protein